MRGQPTSQAKRAIDGLLRAGLKRCDFQVRTEKRRGCYGDAAIWIRNPQRAVEVTDALLKEEFEVHHFYLNDKLLSVIVSNRYNRRPGKLTVRKSTATEKEIEDAKAEDC